MEDRALFASLDDLDDATWRALFDPIIEPEDANNDVNFGQIGIEDHEHERRQANAAATDTSVLKIQHPGPVSGRFVMF